MRMAESLGRIDVMKRHDLAMRLSIAWLALWAGLGIVAWPNPAWAAGTRAEINTHAPRPFE